MTKCKKVLSVLLVMIITFSVFNISIFNSAALDDEEILPTILDKEYDDIIPSTNDENEIANTGDNNEYKPTIYIKDINNRSYRVWAWCVDGSTFFSGDSENRRKSDDVVADQYGYKAFSADYSISQDKMYIIRVSKGNTSTTSWFYDTYAYGDIYIDIDSNGSPSYSETNPCIEIIKSNAFENGVWVDTNIDDESLNSLIKLHKEDASSYCLYIPSGISLTVPIYHTYSNLYIDNIKILSGGVFDFKSDDEYILSGDISGTLSICQTTGTKTMLLNTSKDLPHNVCCDKNYTATNVLSNKKRLNITGGTYLFVNENGKQVDSGNIETIKGRGNSSWLFAYEDYGKYPFNLKLEKKTNKILGGSLKAKKYVFNTMNVDQSSLRDSILDEIARKANMEYTSDTEICNVYDNGEFLGTYLVLTHPDIGKNKLLNDLVSLADRNEEINPDIENLPKQAVGTLKEPGYYSYVNSQSPDDITGGYLLEINLSTRLSSQISSFVSNQGQTVSITSPEYATKEEVEYIKNLFNKMEEVIYTDDVSLKEISQYIDVDSFVKMYIVQELIKNTDSCAASYYIYKDSDKTGDGKFHVTSLWDSDWTCGQFRGTKSVPKEAPNATSSLTDSTKWNIRYRTIPYISNDDTLNIQAQLCQCDGFWNKVFEIWNKTFSKIRNKVVFDKSEENLDTPKSLISSLYNQHILSFEANEKRWKFLKNNPTYVYGTTKTGTTPKDTINYLNNWLYSRFLWIDNNIGLADGLCGDSDNDEVIAITDATIIQKYIAKMILDENKIIQTKGKTTDNEVSVVDATNIQKYLAHMDSSEKIGKHFHIDQSYKKKKISKLNLLIFLCKWIIF